MRPLLRCTKCRHYTINETCSCGGKAVNVKPPKYSPEDKYGEYRRKVKREELEKRGLL